MKTVVNPTDFVRRESVEFFKDFINPYVSVTCNVNASICKEHANKTGEKFFHLYLYAILRAVNDIEELHYRFSRAGEIVRYDRINVITPIKVSPEAPFVSMKFEYRETFQDFKREVECRIQEYAQNAVFGAEDNLEEFDVVLLSAIPDLPFTSLSCTQRHTNGNDYPLITVGKMSNNGEMPIALCVHHAFVDGEHIARVYKLVQKYLNLQ